MKSIHSEVKDCITKLLFVFFFSSRRRHTRWPRDWSSDVCSSDLFEIVATNWDFDQAEYTVTAGEEVKITLVNEEGMHGIAIDGLDVDIQGDGDATFIPEEPGEYKIYCNIPCGQGHNDMVSTLIVQ